MKRQAIAPGLFLLVLMHGSLLGCGSGSAADPADKTQTPPRENALTESAVLTDINPDPDVVEVKLVSGLSTTEYLPGKTTEIWAYRDGAVDGSMGTVPGPLLRAKQGDEVIVHFRNELPDDETTIHWHGLRLNPESDGSPATQVPVRPGDDYEYRFTAKDASSFWYHPHVRGYEQIERGLYAPLVVTGGVEIDVAADRYLVLDDVKLDADGSLNGDTTELDRMLGRQGNVLLVNGQQTPRQLRVAAGSRERWRFVNSANGRYFNLRIPGAELLVIGSDGGILPKPYPAETLLITPGERYDVLVSFESGSGGSTTLQNVYYDRGHDIPDPGPVDLVQVSYGPSIGTPQPLPETWRDLPRLTVDDTTPVRAFVLEELEMPGVPVSFTINGERWPDNRMVEVRQGDTEIWEVKNDAPMDHPFHLHGMFFEVQPTGGVPFLPDGWKDTVNIPQNSSVRLAVRYDPAGMWMFHCHILEHAELGMMGELMVMR
jgi:FtsP/CotA-like multicopper oxidase with cupredoxin domain